MRYADFLIWSEVSVFLLKHKLFTVIYRVIVTYVVHLKTGKLPVLRWTTYETESKCVCKINKMMEMKPF